MSLRDLRLAAARAGLEDACELESSARWAARADDHQLLGEALRALVAHHPGSDAVRQVARLALTTSDPILVHQGLPAAGLSPDELTVLGETIDTATAFNALSYGVPTSLDLTELAHALWDRADPELRLALVVNMHLWELPEAWTRWALDPGPRDCTLLELLRLVSHPVARHLVLADGSLDALTFLAHSVRWTEEEHPALTTLADEMLRTGDPTELVDLAASLDVEHHARLRPGVTRVAVLSRSPELASFLPCGFREVDDPDILPHEAPAALHGHADPVSVLPLLMEDRDPAWRAAVAQTLLRGTGALLPALLKCLSTSEMAPVLARANASMLESAATDGTLSDDDLLAFPVALPGSLPAQVSVELYRVLRARTDARTWSTLEPLADGFTGTWRELIDVARSLS